MASCFSWLEVISCLVFAVLSLPSLLHIWALDECPIQRAIIKDRNGQHRSLFIPEIGTFITIWLKGVQGNFSFFLQGNPYGGEETFFWAICRGPSGQITGNYSEFSTFQKAKQNSSSLWDSSCSETNATQESGYFLCPLKVDQEVCVLWTNEPVLNGQDTSSHFRCIRWNDAPRCDFERIALKSAERYCLITGSTLSESESECQDPTGKTHKKQQILATLMSPDLTCSEFSKYSKIHNTIKVARNTSSFIVPPCRRNSKLKKFQASCTFSYEPKANAEMNIRLDGGCTKGWKVEVSEQMWSKPGQVHCHFSRTHKQQKEWADLKLSLEFVQISTGNASQLNATASNATSSLNVTFQPTGSSCEPKVECGMEVWSWEGMAILFGVVLFMLVIFVIIGGFVYWFYIREDSESSGSESGSESSGSESSSESTEESDKSKTRSASKRRSKSKKRKR